MSDLILMNHLKDVIYQRNTFTRGQLKHLPIISFVIKRTIISSSLREVSTWHFCEQIARSKKTPAQQATENSENKPRGLCFSKAPFEGLIFGGAYIRRGLSTEGNLRFKIDWASLIFGSKFTVFALFYFVFKGNFLSTSPRGPYI